MRAVPLMPFLLLAGAAACGDNDSGATPDAPRPDARIDAAIDAMIDAMIDAPPPLPPPPSRVWAVGDILVDNTQVAIGFTDGATLPFGPAPATAPPISIPNVRAFDAQGAKIAYVADTTVAARFDLVVAAADGASPIVVVQGGVANVEISSVALSPDGTKVAFTMDSAAINNGYDLYVAPTTAGATPVKVSPDRPAGAPTPADQDVFGIFTWSADSKYIAFSGDLTDSEYDQGYVVDTAVAAPTAVEVLTRAAITATSGTRGIRGGLLFDSANNVYFRARIDGASMNFQLFKATPGGVRTVFAVPARADTTAADVGAFAISPDGAKIVFSADAPTLSSYDLYVATLANPTPTKLTSLTAAGNASFFSPMQVSPDGTKVALTANFGGRFEPYVVALDGTTQTPRRLVSVAASCAGCPTPDADAVQWTADGTAIYVRGDLATNNDTRVFRVDPAMTDQAPTLAVTTPANGDIGTLVVRAIP